MEEGRSLTDKDVEAIVNAFEKRFYLNLGQGVWSYVWKVILLVCIGVAASNALHGK